MAGAKRRWSVGELARATGLTVRTLHYYDQVGLVRPTERTRSGHRRYTEASEWLDLVRGLRWHQLNGTPPDDPRVQVLAARWDAVGNAFGTGDDHAQQKIRAAVDAMWRDHGAAISEQVGRGLGWEPADVSDVVAYLHQVRSAGQAVGGHRQP